MSERDRYKRDFLYADWQDASLCAGHPNPDIFYPEEGEDPRLAQTICSACPVKRECLEFALTHCDAFGIWGGLTWEQRKAYRTKGPA